MQNQLQNQIEGIVSKLKTAGSSEDVFKQMYDSNPQFRKFADSVRGMTPEQAFEKHGLDFSQFKGFKW